MIAQGEFMALLRAKSDDKESDFQKTFNTELYQNIVDELAKRVRTRTGRSHRSRQPVRQKWDIFLCRNW